MWLVYIVLWSLLFIFVSIPLHSSFLFISFSHSLIFIIPSSWSVLPWSHIRISSRWFRSRSSMPWVYVMLHGLHFWWGVCGQPVFLQPPTQMLAGIFQAVFMKDDVPHLQRTLSKLLSRHHLDIHVLGLGLSAGLDQTLEHLWGGYLKIDQDGIEGSF